MKLIKNGSVYTPEYIGRKDLLIVNNKIVAIENTIDENRLIGSYEVIDGEGLKVVPGFIDNHVHVIGGGGEAGFHTRTPEINLSDIISSGITTIVGVLGTDGICRNLEALYAKTKGLNNEGVTAFMYTGSYEFPVKNITGSVKKDITFIDQVIGVGEIAIADHRSSIPSLDELKRLSSDVHVASMLSGKKGVINIHMGSGDDGLRKINEIIKVTELPIRHFFPTHVTRSKELFEQAKDFVKKGGTIDITAGLPNSDSEDEMSVLKCILSCVEDGLDLNKITMSSDGNGSMAIYDHEGNVEGLIVTKLDGLLYEIKKLVNEGGIDLSVALKFVTKNVARVLGLEDRKGSIGVGLDADVLLLDSNLKLHTVMAKGKLMMKDYQIAVKGTFE